MFEIGFKLIQDGETDEFISYTDSLLQLSQRNAPNILNTRDDETLLTPLQTACKFGNLNIVKYLCELGANVNNDVDYDKRNFFRTHPIISFRSPGVLACINGHLDVLVYLVSERSAIVEIPHDAIIPRTVRDVGDGNLCLVDNPEIYTEGNFMAEYSYSYSLIFPCAYCGNVEILLYLIRCGANVNMVSERGRSYTSRATTMAAKRNQASIMRELFGNGAIAKVNSEGFLIDEMTAAALSGNFDSMKFCLEFRPLNQSVEIGEFDQDLCGIFIYCIRHDRIVELFLEKVPDMKVSASLLAAAAVHSTTATFSKFLENESASAHREEVLNHLFDAHFFSQGSNSITANLTLLLEWGATISTISDTQFHQILIRNAALPILKALVREYGSLMKRFPDKDILRSSVSGAWNECSDNIQFILQDALINRTINALIRDDTPLMRAVMQQKLSVVKLLISHGADVNFTNEKGKSAIHHAIKWGRSKDGSKDGLEIFNVLRSFGGLIKEDHIRLALKYANVEILQVLLPYPPTEKVRNLIESTLFRFYSRSQYRRWYKFSEMTSDFAILLDYTDVNVNVTNEAGVTLLEIAIGHNASYEFINLLSSKGAKWDLRWGRSAMSVAIHSKAYNSISGLLEFDSSLANMKISSYSTLQLPLEALYPEKDLFQFSRDYEMNIAGFVKLVNLTKDKRVVWNSLSRIIRNWENCRAKLKIADIDILEHEVHERRTLRLIDSIARNLLYTRAEEIGKLESTMYVTDWTISIVRTYFSTIVMFVARNWADPITELPFELWLSVLRYCEPRWQEIK